MSIDSAIDKLRRGLDLDGFDLRLQAVEPDGRVRLLLEARPDACLDCLVPEPTMMAILDNAIRNEYPALTEVVLERAGFDSPAVAAE